MKVQTGTVDSIAYEVRGQGPPLLFIHGITYDRRVWLPLVERLQSQATCILVDLPGHGRSPDRADYSLIGVADSVHHLLAMLECGPPVLIGHSIGAFVALAYAAQHPCRAVIVLDQPLDVAFFAQSMQAACQPRTDQAILNFWEAFEAGFGLGQLTPTDHTFVESLSNPRPTVLAGYWRALLETAPAALQAGIDEMLRSVRVSTSLLHGSDLHAAYAAWLTERIPQARLHVLGGGHFFFLKYRDEVAGVIRSELRPITHSSDRTRMQPD